MNSFRTSELSDLLSNRFRLENSHSPSYLAECLQSMSPSLNRMSLSSITEELAKANGRAFNSSRLPIRGETLNLSFFFELWRRNFRFTSGIYDKFVFTPELQLAFKVNLRDFWEVLVRADRELGTLLKDSYTAYNLRELPQEISINRTAGRNGDDKEILEAVKKSVGRLSVLSTPEIEAACLKLFPNLKQVFSGGNFIEKFCAENSIRKLSCEPFFLVPVSRLEKLTWKFLRDRVKEYSRIKEQGKSLSSAGALTKADTTFRGQEVKASDNRQDGGTMRASRNAIIEIKRSESFIPYFYDDRDTSNPRKKVYRKDKNLVKGTLTIGYGTTKITQEREKAFDYEITESQAEAWMIEDIENIFLADLQRYTKYLFLNQNQFDALMSVIYNMGATKFYKDSGIMEAIRTKDHEKIAGAIENSYSIAQEKFQKGIKERRLRERALYERQP